MRDKKWQPLLKMVGQQWLATGSNKLSSEAKKAALETMLENVLRNGSVSPAYRSGAAISKKR